MAATPPSSTITARASDSTASFALPARPAGRPAAITQDLAGFWRGAYQEVRRELRGRYPRHPWPEDPATATPTALTNRRLQAGDHQGGSKR